MPDSLEHAPDLTVETFSQDDLEPTVVIDFSSLNLTGPKSFAVDPNPFSEPLQLSFFGLTEYFHPVDFRSHTCPHDPLRQCTVVGKDDQTFRIEVEPARRIEPPTGTGQDRPPRVSLYRLRLRKGHRRGLLTA